MPREIVFALNGWGVSVGVVLASGGYPGDIETGFAIRGLDADPLDDGAEPLEKRRKQLIEEVDE